MMNPALSTLIVFFHMHGYGCYIWPVYVFAAVVLGLSIYFPWQERKNLLKKLCKIALNNCSEKRL